MHLVGLMISVWNVVTDWVKVSGQPSIRIPYTGSVVEI